jgi:hypothetical protein
MQAHIHFTTDDMMRFVPALFAIALAASLAAAPVRAQLPYGPDTCSQGYVWREAFPGDHVCVVPRMRDQAASDNSQAAARRQPGGGAYGPDTCRAGFVWREARPRDHVCVTPETRAQTASDNRQAQNRFARNAPDSRQEEKTFLKPRWMDQRLDWCLNWSSECGQPAADNFCRRRRYTGARDFDADPNIGRSEPTRVAGSNQVCDQAFCTGFKYITCFGPIPHDRVFANPEWKGNRLDACLHWGSECGQPPADAFCRNQGFSSAFHFALDAEPSAVPTRLIGTDQVCDKNFCKGFQMIICQ